jgi:hypothetical protein
MEDLMSLEHSPARGGDLLIGAEAIAEFLYGDPSQTRDVYRNVLGLPLFKHGAKIAATRSGLIEEIRNREKAARELIAAGKPVATPPAIPQRQTGKSKKACKKEAGASAPSYRSLVNLTVDTGKGS